MTDKKMNVKNITSLLLVIIVALMPIIFAACDSGSVSRIDDP